MLGMPLHVGLQLVDCEHIYTSSNGILLQFQSSGSYTLEHQSVTSILKNQTKFLARSQVILYRIALFAVFTDQETFVKKTKII